MWDSDPPVVFLCGPDRNGQLGSTMLTVPAAASPGVHYITACAPSCDSVDPVWKETAPFTVSAVVPKLASHSVDEAADLLKAADLVLGSVTGSTEDPGARVVLQTPKAYSVVDPGSAVDITVASAVPPPVLVAVPNVFGMGEDEARTLLAGEGLQLLVESGSGLVSEQRPAVRSRVPVGSQVSVKLRSNVGIELVTVPDVVRLKAAEAGRMLAAAGLVMRPTASVGGSVTSQLPSPGSRVLRGSAVTLTLSPTPSWHPELIAAIVTGTGLLFALIAAVTAVRRTRRRSRRRRGQSQVSVRSGCQAHTVTIRDTGRSATHTAQIVSHRQSTVTPEKALR